ncbi:uncharacterized protein [Linepithema humile]|uniref:uncharacterized protein n=1 Tax=Linepithema humile TaxID=83485 RepID=UPI00351E813E
MAAKKEETNMDQLFEEMKSIAVEQQQCFYELLPDCTIYEKSDINPRKDEHKYLKQNIGYALFGPPTKNEEEMKKEENSIVACYGKTKDPNNTEADITDAVGYDEKAENAIRKIYEKICECLNITDDSFEPIYFGVIYNVIVYFNSNVSKGKNKEKEKKEVKEETKKETEAEVKKEVKEEEVSVVPVPIFKIFKSKKSTQETVDKAKKPILTKSEDCETLYIDSNARVYESWSDYVENNTLQECTMVLPKDGFYQPNPDYPIEEDYSTVWIEIMDSPACTTSKKVLTSVDLVSTAVGIGALGLSIAGLFTPLAPVASISLAGAATASGAWSIFRNTQELVDRYNHKESIYILDKEAFPCWLGLTGSVTGLGAVGGTVVLSKAAANGATIPSAAKVVFNTVQGSNIFLNGVGVVYMSYSMYEKYMEEQTFSYLDALNLATHIMFFASSVVNVKFANDIIRDSQGRVIDDYKKTRRSKNLRKKFNRAARRAAENNTSKIAENAEVIHFIRNRQDFLSFDQARGSQMFDKTSHNTVWSFDGGKIMIGNIELLNPIDFALLLISSIRSESDQSDPSDDSQDDSNNFKLLKQSLHDLLKDFYPDDTPELSDFDRILEDLSSMNISEDCLTMLFNIATTLMKHDKDHFLICFTFVWKYCKANLKQWGIKTRRRMQSESGSYIMQKIINVVSEATGMIFDQLATAAFMYAEANLYIH